MSENLKSTVDGHAAIPVIFVPRVDVVKPRQEVAEKLMCGLLQNEKFLRMLQENLP